MSDEAGAASEAASAPRRALALSRVTGVVMNIAAASGVMSFISFAYSFYKDTKISEASFNQNWQEGEIYGIVFEGSPEGVMFPVILEKLNERILLVREPLGLDLQSATTESLRRALIGLTEKGIVILRDDHTYIVPMAPRGAAGTPETVTPTAA